MITSAAKVKRPLRLRRSKKFRFDDPQEATQCPDCGAELNKHTAIKWCSAPASRMYPEEWSFLLHDPCPDCGLVGEA